MRYFLISASLCVIPAPHARADDPPVGPEFVAMFRMIAQRGADMGPGLGWFRPGASKYDAKALAAALDKDGDGAISPGEFGGPDAAEAFARLDRDRDGRLTPGDFDWSMASPFVLQWRAEQMKLSILGLVRDGRVSRERWNALFDGAALGRDDASPAELARAVMIPQLARMMAQPPAGMPTTPAAIAPADDPRWGGIARGLGLFGAPAWLFGKTVPSPEMPSRHALFAGLFAAEIGSPFEGPRVGETAPPFALTTVDGDRTIALDALRGKTVVLVFGNFTCGPFRSQVGAIEDLKARYGDRAEFVAVYVREAHPTGGWRMPSNDLAGVAVAQPSTTEERRAVAGQCRARLNMTIPLLVDAIDNRVGLTYSGMPDRLYVIDPAGTITYKSGRGPFGFVPAEMEQALILTLRDGR